MTNYNDPANAGLKGTTGSGKFVGQTNPQISDIYGVNGYPAISIADSASATDYISLTSNISNESEIAVASSNSNAILNISGKGTGGINSFGTGTNDDAPTGAVGEYISSSVAASSTTNLTSSMQTNIAFNIVFNGW